MGDSGRTLSTAVHVLRALEFTAEHPKGVSVKALARALDVSLSSAYSLSNSLRYEGFLEVAPTGSGLYVLGPKMVTLYRSYVESQGAVERAWRDEEGWTRSSILNVARMGYFSSDRSIREYCRDIWHAEAYPVTL